MADVNVITQNDSLDGLPEDNGNLHHFLLYGPVSILIIILNTLVLIVVPKVESLRNSTGACMMALAFSDLGVAFVQLYNTIYGAEGGLRSLPLLSIACRVTSFFATFLATVSILTISFLNLDKYLTLKYPLRYHNVITTTKSIVILASIWVVSALLYLPNLAGFLGVKTYPGMSYQCLPNVVESLGYGLLILFTCLIVPTTITAMSVLVSYVSCEHQNCELLQSSLSQTQTLRNLSMSNRNIKW